MFTPSQHKSTNPSSLCDDVMNHDDIIVHDDITDDVDISLKAETPMSSDLTLTPAWAQGFSARAPIETPRNAVRLSRSLKDLVTERTYERLLRSDSLSFLLLPDGRKWNSGGNITYIT